MVILFILTSLYLTNIYADETIEPRNDIIIELAQPAIYDFTSDYKKEILRQRINVRAEGQNPLRTWYFTILKLNDRFKQREAKKLIELYRYGGHHYIDEERVESIYLLNNRVVHIYFPFIDIKDSLANIKVYDKKVQDEYFTVKKKDSGYVDNFGIRYYIPTVKLDFGFVSEIGANIATAKIGKQNGLDYKNYKKKAEIRLQYLKEVYNYTKEKNPYGAVCMGQLIKLLEKELARL